MRRIFAAVIVASCVALVVTSTAGEARNWRWRPKPTPPPTATTTAGVQPAGGVTAQALAPMPGGWPTTVQIGAADAPGGAAALKATAPFGFRYQYLAGGANTGNGWATWNTNGAFVTYYIQDSVANNVIPVFPYYQIRQSTPGASQYEPDGVYNNLQNTATMTAWFNDVKLFMQRAGAFPNNLVVLHLEPDMWGYMQQRSTGDNGTTVPAKVAATGLPELNGLPNTAAGVAQGVLRLRDQYAPNVDVAYHLSVWGTNFDIIYGDWTDGQLDALGGRAGAFYNSLGANFDIVFTDQLDRDAGYKEHIDGNAAAWYDADDYRKSARFLGAFSQAANERIVIWQLPLGNTKMRAQNNTWGHYQDNHVEWWFDEAARTHLQAFVDAGVVAFLFGGGASGTTCACDAMGDGVTNPAPINGNALISVSADDDGGFFDQKAAAYYATGPMPLPGGGVPTATPTRTPTRTATLTPTRTPTRTPTATPTPEMRIPSGETIVPIGG